MSNTGAKKIAEDVCPVCGGTGKFVLPKKLEVDAVEIKEKLAAGLLEKGYSYRQVQIALGYKSVRSISYIKEKLQKEKK